MSSASLQTFKSILTERFTSVAVEIFGEVESMIESCYAENKRLRSILDMVLNPEIKLSKIDLTPHTGANTDVREQTPEPNALSDVDMSEPLIKILKEEMIECDVNWLSEQEQPEWDAYNFNAPVCVKNDPEEEAVSMPCIAASYQVQVVASPPDSSASLSADEEYSRCDYSSPLVSEAAEDCPPLLNNVEESSEIHEHQKCPEASKKSRSKQSKQKTMLEIPRMMPCKSFIAAPPDCQSIVAKLTEAFKDTPGDEKPLITIAGLTADVKLVDFAFGKVPKGCPLSYQCPVPSSQDYKPHKDAPSRPLLPLSSPPLKLRSSFPTLSIKEQQQLLALNITWAGACDLENSTRGSKESLEELRKSRLTGRFNDICKLKPGRSHAEHLIYKLKKGFKTTQAEEEAKAEALREYCRHACVNWSPCGFVVHPNAPWLGVTPDGLVYDPTEESHFGLVHVKCVGLRSFAECSFLACRDGALQLKKSHRYYWHIQGEMMVTGTSWCDLFVFSKEDMLVQRIYRDKVNIRILKKKLDEFFFYYYLPSLI